MKNKLIMLVGAFAVLFTACQPSENRLELTNSFDPDDVTLVAYQETPGSNQITLQMTTEGVMGSWNYNIGSASTDKVTFVYPMTGTHTFTYTISNQYIDGSLDNIVTGITKTIDVTIDQIDVAPADAYAYLVGWEYDSKEWEFAGEPGDGGFWFYMAEGDNPDVWSGCWWNAGNDWCTPFDYEGSMVFNLDGAANLLHYEYDGATADVGTFSFNSSFSMFYTAGDGMILGGYAFSTDPANLCSEFTIIELTDDSFILYCSNAPAHGTGWVWAFRPVE
ncbi:MAG: hypothetical protein R3Y49_01600 [Rikenellaceae bacterium]